jgi:hypothetical protein
MDSRNREYLALTLCAGFYKLSTWKRNSSIPKQAQFSHSSVILPLSVPMIHNYIQLFEARCDIFSADLHAQAGKSHQWILLVPLLLMELPAITLSQSDTKNDLSLL